MAHLQMIFPAINAINFHLFHGFSSSLCEITRPQLLYITIGNLEDLGGSRDSNYPLVNIQKAIYWKMAIEIVGLPMKC